jgi:hypothetical protein
MVERLAKIDEFAAGLLAVDEGAIHAGISSRIATLDRRNINLVRAAFSITRSPTRSA